MNAHELEQLVLPILADVSSPKFKENLKEIEKNAPPPISGEFDTSLASIIDHTILKPEATLDQILRICDEALEYRFASACINPSFVPPVVIKLKNSGVKTCTVIGFPLGASSIKSKQKETEIAIEEGASEVDMVISIGMLKSKEIPYVFDDISSVVSSAMLNKVLTKVIIETTLLTDEEKVIACILAQKAGADFVKTSTCFAKGGATMADIALMRRTIGSKMGIKASGGVRTRDQAYQLISAGATRIGASTSIQLVLGKPQQTSVY